MKRNVCKDSSEQWLHFGGGGSQDEVSPSGGKVSGQPCSSN